MISFWKKTQAAAAPKMERVYLDHAAATPMTESVLAAMLPYLRDNFGNAGAIHTEGRTAKAVVTDARTTIARTLGIQPAGVVFTSGGTEGNNLAIRGVVEAQRAAGIVYSDMEIISTAIEHPATLRTLAALASLGVHITTVPVDPHGHISLDALQAAVSHKTILICVTYINSEIGTVARTAAIKRACARVGLNPLLFVDAAQAPLWAVCNLAQLQADIMTFDGGKCGGPQGVGVLAMQKHVTLSPIVYGGGQERGLRSGTEPTALVVGMATALSEAQAAYQKRAEAVRKLRDSTIEKLLKVVPGIIVNGASGEQRAANNINISIPGLDSEYAVVLLDTHGIAVSTKSACSGAGGGQSAVVLATSGDPARAASTLRITLGPATTAADMQRFIDTLVIYLEKFHHKK